MSMGTPFPSPSSFNSSWNRRSGFALVIALSLMAFVLLLLLSLMTFVQVERQAAQISIEQLRARQNAQLAVMVALGDLQRYAGPDRRVTARSDMDAGAAQKHWTGVWRNPISPREDADDPNWRRDDSRKAAPELLTWLISGKHPDGGAPDPGLASPFGEGENQILLGTVPDPDDPDAGIEVYAGRVPFTRAGSDQTEGTFAYWVQDEGVKAMAGQVNPYFQGAERLKAFQASQRAGIEILDSGLTDIFAPASDPAMEAERIRRLDRIRKGSELKLLSESAAQTTGLSQILPHITMASYGVHADALYGGLKRDLSLAFESDDRTFNDMIDFAAPDPLAGADADPTQQGGGSEFHYRNNSIVTELAPGVRNQVKYLFYEKVPDHPAMGTGEYAAAGGGAIRGNTWHQLRDYYRAYKRVSDPMAGAGMPAYVAPFSRHMVHSYTRNYESFASDLLTQRNHFDSTWRPISRSIGESMVPVLTRERWLHSFRVREGNEPGIYIFDIILSPILTFWNPYNVSLTVDEIDFLKWRPVSVVQPQFHSPRSPSEVELGGHTRLQGRDLYIEIHENPSFNSILKDAFPALSGNPSNWRMRLRMNAGGAPGGEPITFEPGEIKVFTVREGVRGDYDPENPTRDLLLHLAPFQQIGALMGRHGFVFDDAWTIDIRTRGSANHVDDVEYAARLARVTELDEDDGSVVGYNPELIIGINSQRQGFQVGNLSEVYVLAEGERVQAARHWIRFVQGSNSGRNAARIQEAAAVESYALYGIWPRNYTRATDSPAARGDPVADLLDQQHTIYITNFFLKPENYSALYNVSNEGRGYDRFALPVLSHFNPTAPLQWIMTGVRSPHIINDIWNGDTTVLYDWASVPPWPGADFNSTDELVDADGLGYWGRVYNSGPGGSNRVVMREVPKAPMLSVGAFRHANLGLYEHQSMYTVGESFPSPYVPSDRLWETGPFQASNLRRGDLTGNNPIRVNHATLVDWTYLVNEALWDRVYFSGIAPDINNNDDIETVLNSFIAGDRRLSNSRMTTIPGREDLLLTVLDEDGQPTADSPVIPAATTLHRGAFNINSTSVEAWETMLGATLGLSAFQRTGSSVTSDDSFEVPFPRQSIPFRINSEPDSWQQYRGLSRSEVRELAIALVEEVRERGPFTSLSGFVNRRLAPAGDPTALGGVIQLALDAIDINSEFSDNLRPVHGQGEDPRLPADFPYPEHLREGVLRQAATRYLTQGDILQVLGPALSARSDTFSIICYGDSVHPVTGEVRARAYAEAIVQRFPDPVNPSADDAYEPEDPEQFGRRFRLISFNWLGEELDLAQ